MAEDERELWLGELLDAAADRYEPDAERLRAMVTARIAQQGEEVEAGTGAGATSREVRSSGRRRTARGRGLGLIGRLGLAGIPAGMALATIGAAAALAVGATATIAVTSSHGHHTVTVSAPSSTPGLGGSSSQNPVASGSPSNPSSPSSNGGPTSTQRATSGASASASGSSSTSGVTTSSALVAATPSIDKGGNADWSQLDLSVDVKQPLTALHVTVKVSKCAGLVSTGSWDSGATGQFTTTTTTNSDGSITYEFELAQGDEVSPGAVTFAVQFNHAGTGWNAADDTYYVAARTATSTSASSVQGAY